MKLGGRCASGMPESFTNGPPYAMNRLVRVRPLPLLLTAALGLTCADATFAGTVRLTSQDEAVHAQAETPHATKKSQVIRYQGGPVMTAASNTIYIIYYGNFPDTGSPTDTRTILNDFFSSIGGSPQYNVNTTYYDASGTHIHDALSFDPVATVYDDPYSLGNKINDKQIPTIVKNALTAGGLPTDDNGIYFVVTSPDATSHLVQGCAWHDGSTSLIPGHAIKYASIPVYGGKKLDACSGSVQNFGEYNSPNNNLEADNALDSFMHELSETVTDPLPGSGWVFKNGSEVGDVCNFNYGATYLAANGTHADAHIGDRDYLVQTIWQNTGKGFCANTY